MKTLGFNFEERKGLFLLPAILAGISGLGGLFANRGEQQRQVNTNQGYQENHGYRSGGQGSTGTNTYNLDPATQAYLDKIRNAFMGEMDRDPDLKGYEAAQVADVNRLADLRRDSKVSDLAARGIRGVQADTAIDTIDNQRFGQVVDIRNQTPLLARQIRQQNLNDAASFFNQIPINTSTSSDQWYGDNFGDSSRSSSSGVGTANISGNPLGGGISNLASTLAYLFGRGAIGGGSRESVAF